MISPILTDQVGPAPILIRQRRSARIAVVLAAVCAFASLTACGDDDKSSPAGTGESDKWASVTDPINGRTFHCFTIFRNQTKINGDVTGGPAMWCYEVSG